jgi:predicted negative regulator of RcsB-dependent stress response
MNFHLLVSDWDKLIRAGQGSSIVETVKALRASDVPEVHRPAVAALARRLGLLKQGLDILREDYLKSRESSQASELLMTEYAALLTEIGASQISERILSRFEAPKVNMTHFYRALLWIKQWEYEKAEADLKQFRSGTSDEYWQNVADLNLLGALIFLHKWDESAVLLESLEKKRTSLSLMARGVLSELKGQLLFFSGKIPESRRYFENSLESLKNTHNPSLVFVEKWLVITDLMTQPWQKVSGRFEDFKVRMQTKGYWEVLRELDRFYALKFNEEETLAKLYFGTPASGYKRMICRDLNWQPPREFFHRVKGQEVSRENYMDAETMEFHYRGNKISRIPQSGLLLLKALTTDLYRPMAIGSLFEQIYKGQYFDPAFAGQRVHQIISRLRKNMAELKIPVSVEAIDLGFVLNPEDDFSIRFATPSAATKDLDSSISKVHVARLVDLFGHRSFVASELAQASGLSQRSANRLLAQQLDLGLIEKSGSGRAVKYRLKKAA